MATNKPIGDNAQGCREKADAAEDEVGGATAWTKRNKKSGEFIAVKKPAKTKAAKKFKGVRREKRSGK